MLESCVYWLHLPEHTDIFSEGYVGITSCDRFKRRLYEHEEHTENSHLRQAFLKYKTILSTIILKGSREYCLYIENQLRKKDNIGWNIVIGGGDPPNQKGKPKSEETKQKMRKSKPLGFGEGKKNSMYGKIGACNGKKWYYDPITKYSKYFVPDQQPSGWIEGRFSRKKVK